jgi:hypothetical protein
MRSYASWLSKNASESTEALLPELLAIQLFVDRVTAFRFNNAIDFAPKEEDRPLEALIRLLELN